MAGLNQLDELDELADLESLVLEKLACERHVWWLVVTRDHAANYVEYASRCECCGLVETRERSRLDG